MEVIDLLSNIENEEMEETIFYVNGDFFYDLIVIDKNLYVINTKTKQLELLETKYINRFIRNNVELIRLDNFEEIEEKKKIPNKLGYCEENTFMNKKETSYLSSEERRLLDSNFKELSNKINSIIDYLKSKGE